jgi:hypothetical protein
VSYLIEDVTILSAETIQLHVRFRGGQVTSLSVPHPVRTPRVLKTRSETVQALDRLLESCSDAEAAEKLNAAGHRNWLGQPFTAKRVYTLRQRSGLKSRFERLRDRGCLTVHEMAERLGLCTTTVYNLGRAGVLPQQHYANDHRCLYEPLNGAVLIRGQGGRYRPTQARLVRAASQRLRH